MNGDAPHIPTPGPTPGTRKRRGFSLIELLVVISIITIMIAVAFPVVARMADSSRVSSGVQTVSLAAEQARRFAVARDGIQPTVPVDAIFNGVAVIISPSGEIRLTENFLAAVDGVGANTESKTRNLNSPPYPAGSTRPAPWNAFRDIEGLDFISLPGGVDIYGINRTGAGLQFVPPPFAIRYDETGRLITGSSMAASAPNTVDRLVFYDHDLDGDYSYDPVPASGGNLTTYRWDTWKDSWESLAGGTPTWDTTELKDRLPFGTYVAVPGVRVVQSGDDPTNPAQPYTDVFFSRYSGVALTVNREP